MEVSYVFDFLHFIGFTKKNKTFLNINETMNA